MLDSAMILLDEVVQVFAGSHLCALRQDFSSLETTNRSVRCRVAINRDSLW